jgi:hypothetical protein
MKLSTFEAKCDECKTTFAHPSFGDQAYGQYIFCTSDGKQSVHANAFEPPAKKIEQALAVGQLQTPFVDALARCADPMGELRFGARIRCPNCGSERLAYWEGRRIGTMDVPAATYVDVLSLTEKQLIEKLASDELLRAV